MKRWSTLLGGGIGWVLVGGLKGLILGALFGELFSRWTLNEGNPPVLKKGTDFHASLLVLASLVIKADGRVDERELHFVREHFKKWFGEAKAQESFREFKRIVQEKPAVPDVCAQVRRHMSIQHRIQLVAFLFGLAHADGAMTSDERQQIARIAGYLGIHPHDFRRLEAVHRPSAPDPFEVLGIPQTSDDTLVKKTYRNLVKRYHPDAMVGMGEDVVREAEGTFRKIQQAYEEICQQRGIK